MKKDLIIHFSFAVSFFVIVTLLRGWVSANYLYFWLGGIVGTLLPDLDHLIYVYFLRPHEAASQEISGMISERKYIKSWDKALTTGAERDSLIFHNAAFQLIFLLFAFFVVTSTGSLFGRGLVLAFLLHLLVSEFSDYVEKRNLDRWFVKLPVALDKQQKVWFIGINLVLLLVLALVF